MEALILVRPECNKPFILDVDWSIKGVGAILSQNLEGKNKSLLMLTMACLQSSVIFILWKESVMLSFGV